MAHHKSAVKRIQLTKLQQMRNRAFRSQLKTAIKRVESAQDKQSAAEALKGAVSVIDKSVGRKILSKNTAARRKARLTRLVNARS